MLAQRQQELRSICQLMRGGSGLANAKLCQKSESGGGHSPARVFAFFETYHSENEQSGETER
jgi:hypothetical protein